jgi:hypothetical protein
MSEVKKGKCKPERSGIYSHLINLDVLDFKFLKGGLK